MLLGVWMLITSIFFAAKARLLFNPANYSSPFYLYMLRRVANECSPEVKMEIFLDFLLKHPEKMLQAVVPKLQPYINQAEGRFLIKALENRKLKPHVMAHLKPYLRGDMEMRILSPTDLSALLKSYDFHSKQVQYSSGTQLHMALREQFHKAEDIEHMLGSQADLLRAPQEVYCMPCLHRAKLQRKEVWKWLICPACESADNLQSGIKRVIGQLPDAGELRIDEGQLMLPLWIRAEKFAIPAEIDELRVGNASDANWALAAFLQKLNNIPLLANSKFDLKLAPGLELEHEVQQALAPHILTSTNNTIGAIAPQRT
jgi:hypothetical protein